SPIRAPTLRAGNSGRATPSRRSPLAAQGGLLLRRPMADFCSAVDITAMDDAFLAEDGRVWTREDVRSPASRPISLTREIRLPSGKTSLDCHEANIGRKVLL